MLYHHFGTVQTRIQNALLEAKRFVSLSFVTACLTPGRGRESCQREVQIELT